MPDYGCIFVPWYDYREFIIHVVIENGVTHIGNIAFSYCYALVSISIPNSVLTIGHQVFSDCEALLSVFISNKVTGIGSHVFSGCRSLTAINVDGGNAHYSSADGVLFDKEKNILICCPGAKTGDYVIPNSVINIEEWAFLGCAYLTSVSIPGSIKNIGDKAFYYCEELTSVAMSEGVENIGNEAFSYCKNLLSINIPNGVITIGNDAFLNCSTLIAIDIPNSVTSIGNYAFYGCSALAAITLSNNMPTINEGTFFIAVLLPIYIFRIIWKVLNMAPFPAVRLWLRLCFPTELQLSKTMHFSLVKNLLLLPISISRPLIYQQKSSTAWT
jgi:hypothetical protein